MLAAGVLTAGCASSLSTAKTATNGAREVAAAAHDVITEVCVSAYKRAATPADVAAIDARCLPAERAYLSLRASWAASVATIHAVELGQAGDVDGTVRALGPTVAAVGAAVRRLEAP